MTLIDSALVRELNMLLESYRRRPALGRFLPVSKETGGGARDQFGIWRGRILRIYVVALLLVWC